MTGKTSSNPTAPDRSAQMARIKGKNTKPEMKVRKALHAAGLRFRLHDKSLPGKPDIVLASRKCVVEVRGCFWHRHPSPECPLARLPKSRLDFWKPKLEANAVKDARTEAALHELGWSVIVIWECEISRADYMHAVVDRIRNMPVTLKRSLVATECPIR